jgi:hypothetical protein
MIEKDDRTAGDEPEEQRTGGAKDDHRSVVQDAMEESTVRFKGEGNFQGKPVIAKLTLSPENKAPTRSHNQSRIDAIFSGKLRKDLYNTPQEHALTRALLTGLRDAPDRPVTPEHVPQEFLYVEERLFGTRTTLNEQARAHKAEWDACIDEMRRPTNGSKTPKVPTEGVVLKDDVALLQLRNLLWTALHPILDDKRLLSEKISELETQVRSLAERSTTRERIIENLRDRLTRARDLAKALLERHRGLAALLYGHELKRIITLSIWEQPKSKSPPSTTVASPSTPTSSSNLSLGSKFGSAASQTATSTSASTASLASAPIEASTATPTGGSGTTTVGAASMTTATSTASTASTANRVRTSVINAYDGKD